MEPDRTKEKRKKLERDSIPEVPSLLGRSARIEGDLQSFRKEHRNWFVAASMKRNLNR